MRVLQITIPEGASLKEKRDLCAKAASAIAGTSLGMLLGKGIIQPRHYHAGTVVSEIFRKWEQLSECPAPFPRAGQGAPAQVEANEWSRIKEQRDDLESVLLRCSTVGRAAVESICRDAWQPECWFRSNGEIDSCRVKGAMALSDALEIVADWLRLSQDQAA
jgi:hypothetical protein